MRPLRRAPPLALLAARVLWIALVLPIAAVHGEPPRGDHAVPTENTAYVPIDVDWLRLAQETAAAAREKQDWPLFVRTWQDVAERGLAVDENGIVTPHVLPVLESFVYEGVNYVAHHRILAAGAPARAAYAAEFGDAAARLLARGVAHQAPSELAHVVDRFLPLPAARRAALALADLALERGDRDEALGWLQRLQDAEEVSADPDPAEQAVWREARILRMADTLSRPDRAAEAAAFLRSAAAEDAPPTLRHAGLPADLRRRESPPENWTTSGGAPSRRGLPDALGTSFRLAWWRKLESGAVARAPGQASDPARPSPWLPPRAVAHWPHAFVFDGFALDVWDLRDGRRAAAPLALEERSFRHVDAGDQDARREQCGWIEGYALTLGPSTPEGRILYVSVAERSTSGYAWNYAFPRRDRLAAVRFDGHGLELLWQTPGASGQSPWEEGTGDVHDDIRLYGAPLLYRDRVWMAGVRPASGSSERAEAWLYGISPTTGRVETRTMLGTGRPVRPGRPDEAIPSSPAGAAGRIVVMTNLGIISSVDARTGRVRFSYRNDRGVVGASRGYRLRDEADRSPRQSGFVNGPPRLAFERIYCAPSDGPFLLSLFDRPRGSERLLASRRAHRRFAFPGFAAEQIVGIHPGAEGSPPLVILAGKGAGAEGRPPPPMVVAVHAITLENQGWPGISPTGHGAETYGEAALTRGEVFVPTEHGIVGYGVADGRVLLTLDVGLLPPNWLELIPADVPLYGNLVAVPGRGLLAVNATIATWWPRTER